MANPTLKKVIGVKIAAANAGETVILQNETNGKQETAVLNAKLEAIFNVSWSEGDKIIAVIRGSVTGLKIGTISSGGIQQLILAGTADTSSPGVSL